MKTLTLSQFEAKLREEMVGSHTTALDALRDETPMTDEQILHLLLLMHRYPGGDYDMTPVIARVYKEICTRI